MTSLGGAGTAIFLVAIFGLFWAERPWVRLLCLVWVLSVIGTSLVLGDELIEKTLPLVIFLILGLCLLKLPVIGKGKKAE